MAANVLDFLSGMVTMGYAVAALFFARFWTRTGDSLFGKFALAFLLLSVEQVCLVTVGSQRDENTLVYVLRLFAFGLIAAAVLGKNRSARGRGKENSER